MVSHAARVARVCASLGALLILLPDPSTSEEADSIPTSASQILFYEPGQAPPHVVLGVVHAFRRNQQLPHSVYEETGVEARGMDGDMIVEAIAGHDDPLHEGYSVWVLGLAARSAGSVTASDSLRACQDCLVDWRFDGATSGVTDGAVLQALEAKAFATSRLKLARNGYYLQRPSNATLRAPLLLEVRITRAPEGSRDRIAFAWNMTRKADGATVLEFAHSMMVPKGIAFEFMGREARTTHNALAALYSRLPSRFLDADGDGVPDGRDQEPNTPLGFQVDYWGKTLDSDGDGIPNSIDAQPFTIAQYRLMVGSNGIPVVPDDEDYDGVANAIDACDSTDVRYVIDETGCPVEVKEIVVHLVGREKLQERRLQFDTGKAELLSDSKARLDSLGNALSDLPELIFNIDGHCDDQGPREANQILSENRAKAVVTYLLQNFGERRTGSGLSGLKREQLLARGFGEDSLLTPDTTAVGRWLNRRVEISVKNPEKAVRFVEGTRYRLRDEAVDGYQFEAKAGG